MPPKQPADPGEWFIATAPLYSWHPGSTTMPSLTYRTGERVPGEAVARHPDWAAKVRPERPPRAERQPRAEREPAGRPRAGKA
jgi:hypothetical protein